MFMISFLVLGYYAYTRIPVDRFPDVDFPMVTVSTLYEGASAELVDATVTRVIEEELSRISGVDAIISKSYAGLSSITVVFDLDKDVNVAAQEVRDVAQRVFRRLPRGVDPPSVRKINTSLAPIMAVLIHGDVDYEVVSFFADKVVKREFERLKGVGEVHMGGFRDRVLWIRLDPERMFVRNVTVGEILEAVRKNHVEAPAGTIYSRNREYVLRLLGKFTSPEELSKLILRDSLKLGDVARVEFSYEEVRNAVRFNLKSAVALIVYKESKANTVETANRIWEKIEELRKIAPRGVSIDVNYDASVFIKRSVKDALHEIAIGSLLTALTVFLFLGSIRFTLIPVSGNSLNTMSLLALAVAVGIVIDDAIVVLESIYRRNEEGFRGVQAAERGTRTVIFALLTSTASLVVDLLWGVHPHPYNSNSCLLHRFDFLHAHAFREACKSSEKKPLYANLREVRICLRQSSELGSEFLGFQIAGLTKKEFFPLVDEGRFVIRFETPLGSSFEFTNRKAREIEEILMKNPYILRYGMAVGEGLISPTVNGGMFFVTLKDRGERPHQRVVMNMVRKEIARLRDVRASVDVPSVVGAHGSRQTDVQEESGGYTDIDTDIRINQPEIRIRIDRERLGDLGVSVEEVGLTLSAMFGKLWVGTYELGSESYDIYMKAEEDFIRTYENLRRVYVRSHSGELVPLSSFVSYELVSGYTVVGEAVEEIEGFLRSTLPPGYTFEPAGQTREFQRAFKGLGVALLIAVIGVYMVLASLFESLVHPFTVLLTLPLALSGVFGLLSGVFGLLFLTGTSLSVPSYFGIILLVGIVARDSVLFIERILQLRREGADIREAIMKARKERLRPILMTTLTIVFALLPAALGVTEGSELRKPLAVAVIGGLLSALPLSAERSILYIPFQILRGAEE